MSRHINILVVIFTSSSVVKYESVNYGFFRNLSHATDKQKIFEAII